MSNCPARAGFTSATNGCAVRTRDHPRSRGVYVHGVLTAGGSNGSSPLARGLLRRWRARRGLRRIIPARAGFTKLPLQRSLSIRDHPRSRGVYISGDAAQADYTGSSPLARGLPGCVRVDRPLGRIIPARAGFTPGQPSGRQRHPDHPRSRGVYANRILNKNKVPGSSPLARGLRDRQESRRSRLGIIPARAGFTWFGCGGRVAVGDHPRSRGVYPGRRKQQPCMVGSSPLARGLPDGPAGQSTLVGIIPARAGFTRSRSRSSASGPDHPRSRGVYWALLRSITGGGGSSPLARGLPISAQPAEYLRGIIPARAGFTAAPTASHPARRDHPRSRGVYAAGGWVNVGDAGSSPLARGLHFPAVLADEHFGIIPARAGFTCKARTGSSAKRDHPRSRGVYSTGHRV